MAKMILSGMDYFKYFLGDVEGKSEYIIKCGLYDGANTIYEGVKAEINNLRTEDQEGKHRDVTELQKKGLLDSLYGSSMQKEEGTIFEVISFTGYNNVITKKYPNGQPNILIARCLESGASKGHDNYMNKQPFMRPALSKNRKKAVSRMQETMSNEVKKLQK